MILAYAILPMLLTAIIVGLVLAFGHMSLRHNGRQPIRRTTSYVAGLGTIGLALTILLGAWALLAPQVGISPAEAFVLAAIAFWVLTVAGALPTLALRQMFGDPDDVAAASSTEVHATLDQIRREAKEIANAATQQGA